MLDNLTQRLGRVVKTLRGEARLTEANIDDALREVRMALLEADVALPVVKDFIAAVRDKAVGQEVVGSLTPGQALIGVVQRELTALMGEAARPHRPRHDAAGSDPARRTAGRWQDHQRRQAGAASAPGPEEKSAIGKLRRLSTGGDRPVANARHASRRRVLSLAARTSARWRSSRRRSIGHASTTWTWSSSTRQGALAIDEAMMREIAQLHAAARPIETLFVVDAMQGQDAVNTAKAFAQALPLTGIVLTKLDGDARGGAALSVRSVTGAPIKFVGVSEKIDGLELFHPDRMASRILGMGDVLTLIEDAHRQVDVEQAQKLARKVKSGKGFDLDDFKAQIGQMRKMGGMQGLLDKLPSELARAAQGSQVDDRQIRRLEGIINSMTPAGARQAGAAQGLAQASHRRRRRRERAGGKPAARAVRADAKDDEDGRARRNAENAARAQGAVSRSALKRPAGVAAAVAGSRIFIV